MIRVSAMAIALSAQFIAASAEEMCGAPRQGQYAEEQTCVNALAFPDGRPGPAKMLNSVPETYPWLFSFTAGEPAPWQMIKVRDAADGFSALQFINGWAPYDSTGAEKSQFSKYSRVREILIESSSGHSFSHTLGDVEETQFVALPEPAVEEWVRIKVLSVYPGPTQIAALRWFSVVWEGDL